MKRFVLSFCLILAAAGPLAADASAGSVGLGLSLGAAVPQGSTASVASTDGLFSFNWGFYVNIPLISTFHITPSSELYYFNALNATDIDIAFKFIVPLGTFDVYAGVAPGLTAVQDVLLLHVGGIAGASFPVVSNLSAFAQVKYTFLFDGDRNIRVTHLTAGLLFSF
jgi:hypothetical protein